MIYGLPQIRDSQNKMEFVLPIKQKTMALPTRIYGVLP
jgi:hypothetical protein